MADDDVKTVAHVAEVAPEQARAALKRVFGNVSRAISDLIDTATENHRLAYERQRRLEKLRWYREAPELERAGRYDEARKRYGADGMQRLSTPEPADTRECERIGRLCARRLVSPYYPHKEFALVSRAQLVAAIMSLRWPVDQSGIQMFGWLAEHLRFLDELVENVHTLRFGAAGAAPGLIGAVRLTGLVRAGCVPFRNNRTWRREFAWWLMDRGLWAGQVELYRRLGLDWAGLVADGLDRVYCHPASTRLDAWQLRRQDPTGLIGAVEAVTFPPGHDVCDRATELVPVWKRYLDLVQRSSVGVAVLVEQAVSAVAAAEAAADAAAAQAADNSDDSDDDETIDEDAVERALVAATGVLVGRGLADALWPLIQRLTVLKEAAPRPVVEYELYESSDSSESSGSSGWSRGD